MKLYDVKDKTLRSIHVGENSFTVEDGQIELPVEVAQEFIASGQIAPLPKGEKPSASQMTPAEIAKVAREAKAAAKAAAKANSASSGEEE